MARLTQQQTEDLAKIEGMKLGAIGKVDLIEWVMAGHKLADRFNARPGEKEEPRHWKVTTKTGRVRVRKLTSRRTHPEGAL